jgi:hypothetical protein
MGAIKNRKILQIFSNGSLTFCYRSFSPPQNIQLLVYGKDLKNFHLYSKRSHNPLNLSDSENLFYRKKYVNSKN